MDGGARCSRPATWSITIECDTCGMKGDGPACGWHKVQVDEWGVPHRNAHGEACPTNAPITAIPLR